MEFPRMLYRLGSTVELEGHTYDWRIVSETEYEAATAEGWRLDIYAALESKPAPAALAEQPRNVSRRDDLLAKAQAKGVRVDKRWSDDRLAAEIDKAA